MKSHLEVDLNEFLQEKMETDLFEGVDEENKARFIGNFFSWVRNIFSAKKYTPVIPLETAPAQAPVATIQKT